MESLKVVNDHSELFSELAKYNIYQKDGSTKFYLEFLKKLILEGYEKAVENTNGKGDCIFYSLYLYQKLKEKFNTDSLMFFYGRFWDKTTSATVCENHVLLFCFVHKIGKLKF